MMERLFRGVSVTGRPPSPRFSFGELERGQIRVLSPNRGQTVLTQKVNVGLNSTLEKTWRILVDCSTGENCIM